MQSKFVFISGGVISGLGKGITTASIGLLLKSSGLKVSAVKCDMYLNIDAGTMNPLEHGEIFVTDDGTEADQDLGHYERFLDVSLNRENYITAGQIYQKVLERERALEYDGKCVEAYYHIPPEIISRFESIGKKAEVVLIEFGGTVGEYQNIMFFEAARRMRIKYKENVLFVHVGYLPIPPSIGEMKTKPLQQSIHELNELGIQPDFVICRSEKPIDSRRKEKVALA
ncbi:CTP synthase, partial [Candidatus Shapirobacteria bacterium CG_4_9_14_0_2_um_filter_39_11]